VIERGCVEEVNFRIGRVFDLGGEEKILVG
jgi:hypothetical protein